MERHKTVEAFLGAAKQWKSEMTKLRKILKSTELAETVKWGLPTYTLPRCHAGMCRLWRDARETEVCLTLFATTGS